MADVGQQLKLMILPMDVKGRGVETGQIGEGRLLMTLANLVAEFSTGKFK